MDEQLSQIGGKRLGKLRRPDLPQLAQAIVDAERGKCRATTGALKGKRFVNLRRKGGGYDVYVRGEDWDKIFPFLRNSASTFEPAPLPVEEPPPIPAVQANRLIEEARESPSGGRSFIQGRLDYDTQRLVTDLLTTTSLKSEANLPSRPLVDQTPGPQINPPVPPQVNSAVRTASALDMREEQARRRILDLLLQLFPEDFPTSAL